MNGKAHFQWQNEHLLRTIYPLREMKLRDFLFFFHEIEIWDEHKSKTLQDSDMQADMAAFLVAQEKEDRKVHGKYHRLLAYFRQDELQGPEVESGRPAVQEYREKCISEHRNFQKFFFDYDSVRKQGAYLENYILRLEGFEAKLKSLIERTQRNLRNFQSTDPDNARIPVWEEQLERDENSLALVTGELSRLYDLLGTFNQLKTDLATILARIRRRTAPDDRLDLERMELQAHEPERVMRFLRAEKTRPRITVNHIAQWKAQQYRRELEEKTHEELIGLIVDKFLDDPTAHPLWLQYMAIHFSGMRYQSSHGSWGDPKDILLSLKIKAIHDKLKSDPDEVLQAEAAFEAGILRRLPGSSEPDVQRMLRELESGNIYRRRNILLNIWVDKKKAQIEALNEEQVLIELEGMSDRIPVWMWKEIVARTDLRLAHAGADWETLSAEDKEGYYDRINAEFREILVQWKAKNLTMWREEHARANRLIVTRAVCNEVAEHIQHLRGISPPGGLTAKPLWYRNEEKAGRTSPGGERPSFGKIHSYSDLKPGASILWLRWVRGKPNIWRIARPLKLKDGDGLLPAGLTRPNAQKEIQSQKKVLKKGARVKWVHEVEDNAFKKSRYTAAQVPKANNPKQLRWVVSDLPETQWIRWMHEATIVGTGETAEGLVVLTFETALPYEDPRRSTIGVFKRYPGHLIYNVNEDYLNGTFAGYLPPGTPPLADLKAMLDWRKIAPHMLIPQEKIDRYWQAVEDSLKQEVDEAQEATEPEIPADVPTRWVEAAPPFEKADREFTLCYRVIPDPKRPGKFKDEVVQPRIELRRGLHFEVAQTGVRQAGKDSYARIVRCAENPLAEGKYVRDADSLALPDEKKSLPFKTRGMVTVRSLKGLNDKRKPVLLPAGIKLMEGTIFRASAVHHQVSDAHAGAGRIDTDGTEDYYLIVACPSRPVAEGLFIKAGDVESVGEEEYESLKLTGPSVQEPGSPVRARVEPEGKGSKATLFKAGADSGKRFPDFTRVWQTMPGDWEISAGNMAITKSGKVFYRVEDCQNDASLNGLYIRRKEMAILPPLNSPIS